MRRRTARESCGYAVEEVAGYCGISVDTYKNYEKNSGEMIKVIACKLKRLYSISLDLFYVGTEAECHSYNRNNAVKYACRK